jgi:hypothetical protein
VNLELEPTPAGRLKPKPSASGLGPALWILILAGILVGAATIWRVRDMLSAHGSRAIGDGRNPDTYGFDLSPLLVERDLIAASGLPRDGLPVLDFPPLMTPAQVDSMARHRRSKYLVSHDRVLGVVINGAARAYPLRVLNWHEIVNDTLAGRPIAVTYSPLCDAGAVFDRRRSPPEFNPEISSKASSEAPGPRDPYLFGHSGLLYNSDLLLYDRGDDRTAPSLWSQLQARAVSGPAAEAGARLAVLSAAVVQWSFWKDLHPETTVLAPDPSRMERYGRDPYANYYGSDLLRFPVRPLPPRGGMEYKTPCVAIRTDSTWTLCPLPVIASHADRNGIWSATIRGAPVRFVYRDAPPTVLVERIGPGAESPPLPTLYSFWFAWYSTRPGEMQTVQ